MATLNKIAVCGDEAVRKATGKSWDEWCSILDASGGKQKQHKEIVALLTPYQIGGWWQQMVTVGYEQARGLRQKNEKADGFSISASRVIAAPLARLYAAWVSESQRASWLPDVGLVVRKATKNKSMRITWSDERTSVNVNFYAKGDGRSQVVVEHEKLATAAAAAKMKKYWGATLDRLREHLEHPAKAVRGGKS